MNRLAVYVCMCDTELNPSKYWRGGGGVDISSGLSWNTHINRITAKANSTHGFVKRIVKTQNHKVRETSYKRLFARSRSMWPLSGILKPNERYSSLKRFKAGLPDGPPKKYANRSSVTAMLQD